MSIYKLKPMGSMIIKSDLTDRSYHVTKFYTRVKQEGTTFEFKGFEAVEKHDLGTCKHCKIGDE